MDLEEPGGPPRKKESEEKKLIQRGTKSIYRKTTRK